MDEVTLTIVEIVDEVALDITTAPASVALAVEDRGAKELRETFVAPYHYIGRAQIGSADEDSVWKVYRKRISAVGIVDEERMATHIKWTEILTEEYA